MRNLVFDKRKDVRYHTMGIEVVKSSLMALYSFIFHLVFLPVGAFPL